MRDSAKISGLVITFNEEENIGRCLDSMKDVVDELIVVDSFSEDETARICREKGAKLIEHKFEGHIEQKNFAVAQASYPYVLSLDADEALDDDLKAAILKEKTNLVFDAYTFRRKNFFCGKWIRYGGWYPDRKIRLWNKEKGKWGGENPHDKVLMQGGTSSKGLGGNILHYSFASTEAHSKQVVYFAKISAVAAFEKGKRAHFGHLILKPFAKFLQMYVLKAGFLDGYYGFLISINSAYGRFLKYNWLKELGKKSSPQ